MPALQVRDFPEDLYEQLKEYSARNHRSLAQQVIAFVEAGVRQPDDLKVREGFQAYKGGKALERERSADDGLQLFDNEDEETRKARGERRKAMFDEAWAALGPLSGIPSETIVGWVRHDREHRQDWALDMLKEGQ